jgi:hypothetical protein
MLASMRVFWAILIGALAILPDPAAAQHFAPHRALYEMSLHGTGRDSSIMSVDGEMAIDWTETCEGWALEHRSSFDIGVGGEQSVRLSTHVATWEARDGLSYRFNVRNVERDGSEERIEGSAKLDGKGKGGTVRYTKPDSKTVTLPVGTIFPTAHSDEVLDRAGDATASFKRIVFDGLSADGLFDVSAVIGAPYPKSEPKRDGEKPVAGLRSWPTHIAFYRYGSADAAPDNEVSFRMYENGVADEMIIDFGQFKVLAVLKALELAPRPTCK